MPLIEGALYGHLKGGTSFLDAYKNRDARDMASKIQRLIGNAPLREKLQEGIEDTVMHLMTQRDFEKGIEEFYKYVNNG